ncbi:hypothetical protein RHMOL_Rhmol04G0096100 [Rhododendron molle]|uniref:Uncharacterized protein n=1 Tax=Rhododendron molle TaxID=49168 RepID=A0ACC0NZT7_RHOML|nr:hypothetical protein RHMOL_Rhmol04G0096100 [Rhododendron molle]
MAGDGSFSTHSHLFLTLPSSCDSAFSTEPFNYPRHCPVFICNILRSVYLQTRKQDNPKVKEMMFEKLQYHMFEYMESRGSEAIQFPDTASGHRTVRDQSIGGDTPTLERGHRTPTRSPGPIEQVSYAFCFMNPPLVHARQPGLSLSEKYTCKRLVFQSAMWLLISSDPDIQIDGERLGEGYCKVYVGKAIIPHVLLERPRPGVDTVGDALGRYVAWNICDVIEKEMDDY